MFRKPIKVKSNSQVKGSDRKTIKDNLLKSFPNLTETNVEDLMPKKEIINSVKLVTSANEVVHVYTIQKRPVVFDVRGVLFPTVYLLWKFPDLVPSFITHPQVLSFLTSGADLMLPGVITPPPQSGLSKYGNLSEGAIAYASLSTNKAAIAVGITAQRSSDMLASGGRGKCLTIYHFFGDKLCTLEGVPNLPIVDLGPPDWLKFTSYDEDFPELGASRSPDPETVLINNQEDTETAETNETLQESPQETSPVTCTSEEMDELLNYSFFVAIKYSKSLNLPILTSNFYKLQMIPVCPEGKSLDLKKSSFKKLKPFLDSFNKFQDGIITVKEAKKGVESITAINKDHPKFAEFYIEPSLRPRKEEAEASNIPSTSVTESFIITPNVLPIFSDTGFKYELIKIIDELHAQFDQ
ncbi:eukaryotic translation initiation factor 2D [Asbolus verrucosus]|uniref:Eukaryotic translation initiation factor 2D n=1 Tax=Asbolus verrucosus TaxID=1661398 RepID=A0A482W2M0_ASBVE|nr:eukaryotic translation initiation factor 2D [Asbolus verrucosus]